MTRRLLVQGSLDFENLSVIESLAKTCVAQFAGKRSGGQRGLDGWRYPHGISWQASRRSPERRRREASGQSRLPPWTSRSGVLNDGTCPRGAVVQDAAFSFAGVSALRWALSAMAPEEKECFT